jgi:hypothetical protein
MAFIGAQRRPLTEEADGSGAGFSQEGMRERKTPTKKNGKGQFDFGFSKITG